MLIDCMLSFNLKSISKASQNHAAVYNPQAQAWPVWQTSLKIEKINENLLFYMISSAWRYPAFCQYYLNFWLEFWCLFTV